MNINSPEMLRLESNETNYKDFISPKMVPRIPKLKLNLDIPEDDKIFNEKLPKNDKKFDTSCHERVNITKLNNSRDSSLCTEVSSSISLMKSIALSMKSIDVEAQFSSPNSLNPAASIINLPLITSFDSPLQENNYFGSNYGKNGSFYSLFSFTSIPKFFDWITKNVIYLIKKNYKKCSKIFGSIYVTTLKNEDKLCDVISIIRSENEHLQCTFGRKITNVMQELSQIRTTSDETLNILNSEIETLKNSNKMLINKNDDLIKNYKSILSILKNIQLNLQSNVASNDIKESQQPVRLTSVSDFFTPPPPPPPLPPLPTPATPLSLSTTPKSTKKCRSSRTPTRKSMTTDRRPVITVEDLLKVTLKKAPQKIKESKRKTDDQQPLGSIISIEMLKDVKLKSTRRRNYEKSVRSPLRTQREYYGSQSLSLTPIITEVVKSS